MDVITYPCHNPINTMLVKGTPVASFTKEVNLWLAKCPLIFNGHLANHRLTSFVKEATGHQLDVKHGVL